MPILNSTQITAAAVAFANDAFVKSGAVANLSTTDVIALMTAIDTAMASTPSAFAAAHSGSANVGAGFGAAASAAVPTSTSVQQSIGLYYWAAQIKLSLLGG